MRKDQDFLPSRRNRFEEDAADYRPQRSFGTRPRFTDNRFEPQTGPPVGAVVKWFSSEKGFGFVTLQQGGDAFLHGSVLARNGVGAVAAGDNVTVRVAPGQKGQQVTEVLNVEPAAAGTGSSDAGAVAGTVSWFDAEKGFGFISRDDGMKDVFVHISALERSGLSLLGGGQRVVVDVTEGRKGPEAARVRLA